MAVQRTSRAFRDISLSFRPHPVTGDLPILRNENAIIRSIRNLVETIPNERFFNSTIGSDVRSSLFDNPIIGTEIRIKDQIESTIRTYEDRVENLLIEVDFLPDLNSIDVTVHFDIIGNDFPQQTINFILEATR
jgi:hypothetical protein|tara:strand:- start:26808 stop:27209 length:402 start_codon:yes stop_codon:yes gene_type:complete